MAAAIIACDVTPAAGPAATRRMNRPGSPVRRGAADRRRLDVRSATSSHHGVVSSR